MRLAPLPASSLLRREVFGFVNAGNLGDPSFGYPSWNMRLLSTVAYFGLSVQPGDGSVVTNSTGWQVLNSSTMSGFVNYAHSFGTRVILSLNARGNICGQLAPSAAQVTTSIAVQQAQQHGLDGINIDYEGDDIVCPNNVRARDGLVAFAKGLRAALPNYYIAVDTYTGSAEDNLEFFDITGLEPYVDAYFVMAYDMDFANYSEAPLNCTSFCFNPISPLNTYRFNVTNSMAQYSALVPASKVILGQPLYGRRGCVPNLTDAHQYPTTTADPQFATPTYYWLTHVTGVSGFAGHRDPGDGVSEWDTFFDANAGFNCNREQYWDDIGSLGAKFDLANRDNIGGVGFFTLDYAGGASELWSDIATHFTLIPGAPGDVNACPGNGSVTVSWTAAPTRGGPVTSYQVTAQPGGATVTAPATATLATLTGLTPATSYTLTIQAINSSGAGVGETVSSLVPSATPALFTSYFNWFDRATGGMVADNIHLLNAGATASSGCALLSGLAVVPFNLAAGQETYVSFPPRMIGGPVVITVNSGPAVLASQRVQYFQSFNEVWAMSPAQAATTLYIPWFDKVTPGMVADNIHVLNPGATVANIGVGLPGQPSINFPLPAGAETYVTFPFGVIGGPVTITADHPVLAAQRVQYFQSFNEEVARSAAQASTTSFLHWFDKVTPGMVGDNLHILNTGAATAAITVSLPGASNIVFTLPAGAETYVTFPYGKISGPVTVTSSQPVLASQRVQYFQSFNEVASETAAVAATTSHIMWFDKVTPGMVGDNVHILNTSATTASITVSLPGASNIVFTLPAGAETYVTFPFGQIGGPVTVTSNVPVLAAQRVQYFQSFNEVPAA